MNKKFLRSIVAISMAIIIALAVSKANAAFVKYWNGYSIYLLAGLLAFVINWLVFIPSYIAQTEKYYDLTGSLTYLSVLVTSSLVLGDISDNPRAILIAILVGIWTIRLGSFLFSRIMADGKDGRFDEIKPNFFRFLTAWTLQGLWVFLTLSAGLAVLTSIKVVPIDVFAIAGAIVWLIGFGIEVTADT